MADTEHKPPQPLPQREVIDPEYRGNEVGKPFACRDTRNRKRIMPGSGRAILDERAGDYFGID